MISKTAFIKLHQCEKAFYFYKKHPYLRDKLSLDKQLIFKRGTDVGVFAQQLFPGGVDVSLKTKSSAKAAEYTNELIQQKTKVIYEATFIWNDVLVMLDILVYDGKNYQAYEIKSSLKISEVFLLDAGLQYFAVKENLKNFNDFYLVTLNADYVLEGNNIEVKKLFKKRNINEAAQKNREYYDAKIKHAKVVLEKDVIPNTPIGKHCFKPYACDFFNTCWGSQIPNNSIFNLPFVQKDKIYELFDVGLKTIDSAKESLENYFQNKALFQSICDKTLYINSEKIVEFLSAISFPVMSLDIEVWAPAIPFLNGTRPFSQLPFLFSTATENESLSFFMDYNVESKFNFANELIKRAKNFNSILVYGKSMEIQILNDLITEYPTIANELSLLKQKIIDLSELFTLGHYYTHKLKNDFSLKNIYVTLTNKPWNTEIYSGLQAMNVYQEFIYEENEINKCNLQTQLIAYCSKDAEAVYEIFNVLVKTACQ
ncbi:MAG: DUF2779 domain-containing protein [Bacteroidetes bacterium]|nr:DUF2779 domain-containing protein [Bacteroidota bacterium]